MHELSKEEFRKMHQRQQARIRELAWDLLQKMKPQIGEMIFAEETPPQFRSKLIDLLNRLNGNDPPTWTRRGSPPSISISINVKDGVEIEIKTQQQR